MKIEDYLQKHNKSLEFDEPLNEVWTAIEGELPNSKLWNKWVISGVILLGLALSSLLYFTKSPLSKSQKKAEMPQHDLFARLDSDHSGQRIWAVSQMSSENTDEAVIEALIYTLKHDESLNVKIATVRALEKYTSYEAVRIAIIDLLETVDDSYLKIKLIHLLTRKKIIHAIPALDQLIDRKDTRDIVKEEATASKMELISL